MPTVPVPKSICELALRVSARIPTADVVPSLKLPLANVPPFNVMVAELNLIAGAEKKSAAELTAIELVEASALPELAAALKVPPLTVVLPLKVLAAPRVRVPIRISLGCRRNW